MHSEHAGNKLFVGGLSFHTDSYDLQGVVSQYGEVLSVEVQAEDSDFARHANALVVFVKERDEARASASKPKKIVVVDSKIQKVAGSAGLRSDGELVQAVSDKVEKMMSDVIVRCKINGRKMVLAHDL